MNFNRKIFVCALCAGLAMVLMSTPLRAGGGMVLRDGNCILEVGFYEVRFAVYQPQTHGDERFCQELPDVGESLFVFDYLHDSMKKVPVAFRIIKDVNKLGRFVRMSDIDAIKDIESVTVFYDEPTVHPGALLSVDYTFDAPGRYIGIVTAGHPTRNTIYAAVFPFTVGKTDHTRMRLIGLLILIPLVTGYYFVHRLRAPKR